MCPFWSLSIHLDRVPAGDGAQDQRRPQPRQASQPTQAPAGSQGLGDPQAPVGGPVPPMRQVPHGDSHRMEKLGRGIPALSGRPTPSVEACSLRCPGAEFLGGLERGAVMC